MLSGKLWSLLTILCLGATKAFAPVISLNKSQRRQNLPTSPSQIVQHKNFNTQTTTALSAAIEPVALAAITGAITGGLFAGGLHAIAGTSICCLLLFLNTPTSTLHRPLIIILRPRSSRGITTTVLWTALVPSRPCWSSLGHGTRYLGHPTRRHRLCL